MTIEATNPTTATRQLPAGGFLRVYRCQCDEFTATAQELPSHCPGHNAEAILLNNGDPHDWIPNPTAGYGHLCSSREAMSPCPPPDQAPLPLD